MLTCHVMCSLHKLLCILVLCIVYYMIIHNAVFKGVVLGVVVMCACASIITSSGPALSSLVLICRAIRYSISKSFDSV